MLFYGEEGGSGRARSEPRPAGEKQFRVMESLHRVSCGGSISRRRDSACLSLVGPGLMVLPVVDTVWSGSPFQPPLLASTAHFSETSLRSCSHHNVLFPFFMGSSSHSTNSWRNLLWAGGMGALCRCREQGLRTTWCGQRGGPPTTCPEASRLVQGSPGGEKPVRGSRLMGAGWGARVPWKA